MSSDGQTLSVTTQANRLVLERVSPDVLSLRGEGRLRGRALRAKTLARIVVLAAALLTTSACAGKAVRQQQVAFDQTLTLRQSRPSTATT